MSSSDSGRAQHEEQVTVAGMGTAPGEGIARCAAVFVPGEPAREGKVAFWRPDGGTLPEPGPGTPDTPP
ncbi:MAG: hypothetical protein ACRDOV_02015, partial [Streptomyces sp.]